MNTIITINRDLITNDGEDWKEWEKTNEDYLVKHSSNDPLHSHEKLFLDLKQFFTKKGPDDWTEKNGKYLCFEGSKEAIEDVHTIDIQAQSDLDTKIELEFNASKNKEKVSVTTLKDRGYIFDSEDYEKYMILTLENNKLSNAVIDKYDKTKFCFSFPFFKSILENNHQDKNKLDECFFNFVEVELEDGKALAFFVEFSNKTKKYYDYSQNPPRAYFPSGTTAKGNNNLFHEEFYHEEKITAFNNFKKQF